MEQATDNFRKHTSKNPIQKILLDNFFNTLVQIIRPRQVSRVLDVGCGEGFTLSRLSEQKIGEHLEGIEYSKTAIEIGRKIHPKLTFKQGDIYNLPYKNNSFDLVISTEVLEHLENPKRALLELIRVSGKYLLLSVPNEPWFRIANFLRGKNISRFGNDVEHIQHWSNHGFSKFVTEVDKVKIIVSKYPFPWTIVLVNKL